MPTTNLTLQVQPGTDVLDRVVCICRRRNLRILALTYTDKQITLAVAGDGRQTRSIERWLSSLVDVLHVKPRCPCHPNWGGPTLVKPSAPLARSNTSTEAERSSARPRHP